MLRLKIAIAVLAALVAVVVVLLLLWSEAPARPDPIRHVASTRPVDSAVEVAARAAEPVPLVGELSQRPGVDWPGFLGPTGDGRSTETGLKPWADDGPRVAWSVAVGEGYAAPTVCLGRVLVFDRVSAQVRCRCLNSATGAELWRFTYPTTYLDRQGYDGGPRACPVTDGARVYLHGPEGLLHCLRLADGKLLWKIDTHGTFGVVQNLFGAASAPLLDGDRLLLPIGGSPAGSTDDRFMELESNGSCIVAFDKTTGKVLYQCGHDLASYASPQIVSLAGKKTALIFARSGLLGFDPQHGSELFHYPFRASSYNSVNASNVVIDGDRLFLTESYELGCVLLKLRGAELSTVWSASPRERDAGLCCHWNTPILVDGHLYGCASRHRGDAELRCIELATGQVKWRARPTLNDEPAGRSSLLYADGHFLCLSEEGMLFLIEARADRYEQVAAWDGRQSSTAGGPCLRLPCWAAPVLSHGLLYLRGKGLLVCLELME